MTEHTKQLLRGCNTVLGIVRVNGECDAENFIRSLDRTYQARYQRWFEYMRDGKPIKNPENLRHLRSTPNGVVWELKSGGYRLYLVLHRETYYATHGIKKVKDKQVNGQIDKALATFADRIL